MRWLLLWLLLTFTGPIWLILSRQINLRADYRTANRNSANIAPDPLQHPESIVQVYYARTFNWRGAFAVHTWIATKEVAAKSFTVYHVIGWRLLQKLSPLVIAQDLPDRYWFAEQPHVIKDFRGKIADKLIPQIKQAVHAYPFQTDYSYWPGPNSNTFTAMIARKIPAMQLTLPSNAIGKDYLPKFNYLAKTPSGTGWQLSISGIFGITLALEEGLEINIFGLVYGISPKQGIIKLPGFGDIKLNLALRSSLP